MRQRCAGRGRPLIALFKHFHMFDAPLLSRQKSREQDVQRKRPWHLTRGIVSLLYGRGFFTHLKVSVNPPHAQHVFEVRNSSTKYTGYPAFSNMLMTYWGLMVGAWNFRFSCSDQSPYPIITSSGGPNFSLNSFKNLASVFCVRI